ncbi:MAG: hypothetical protein AABX85_01775 [Nanoarchaeota archaeon]
MRKELVSLLTATVFLAGCTGTYIPGSKQVLDAWINNIVEQSKKRQDEISRNEMNYVNYTNNFHLLSLEGKTNLYEIKIKNGLGSQ